MHHCFRLTNPQTHHRHHHHPVPSFHTHTHTQTYKFKRLENFFLFESHARCSRASYSYNNIPPSLLIFLISAFLSLFLSHLVLLFMCFYRPSSLISLFPLLLLTTSIFFPPPLLMHPPFHFAPLYSLCHSHPPLPHPIPDLFGCFVLLISSPFPPPASPFSSPSLYCKMQFHILYSLFFFSSISSKHLKEQ